MSIAASACSPVILAGAAAAARRCCCSRLLKRPVASWTHCSCNGLVGEQARAATGTLCVLVYGRRWRHRKTSHRKTLGCLSLLQEPRFAAAVPAGPKNEALVLVRCL